MRRRCRTACCRKSSKSLQWRKANDGRRSGRTGNGSLDRVCSGNPRQHPKRHDHGWKKSTRLWTGLCGEVSTLKTPILKAATDPIVSIDLDLMRQYMQAKEYYDGLSKEERKQEERPRHHRMRIEDTTPEAAGEIMRDSPDGVLCFRDELSDGLARWTSTADTEARAQTGAFGCKSTTVGRLLGIALGVALVLLSMQGPRCWAAFSRTRCAGWSPTASMTA